MKLGGFATLFLLCLVEGQRSSPHRTLRRKISSEKASRRRKLDTGSDIDDTTYEHCGKGGKGKGDSGSRRLNGCSCSKGSKGSCYEDGENPDPGDDPIPEPTPSPVPEPTSSPVPEPTPSPVIPSDGLGDDSGSNQSMDVEASYDPYVGSNDAAAEGDNRENDSTGDSIGIGGGGIGDELVKSNDDRE